MRKPDGQAAYRGLLEENRRLAKRIKAMERDRRCFAAINENGWSVTVADWADSGREWVVWETCVDGLGKPLGDGPTLQDAILAALENET